MRLCASEHKRKNWLFSNTVSGANASSILYSIVETAKANNLVPFDYLHYLFKALSERDQQAEMEDLLSWSVILDH